MQKRLTKSKTIEEISTKLEKRLSHQKTLPSFDHAGDFDYKRDTRHLMKIVKHGVTSDVLDLDAILHFLSAYTCEQRMTIVHDLEYEYHYKLIDMVLERSESSVRSCTLAMLIEPLELYVRHLHNYLTLKLTGQIEGDISPILIEILVGLSNADVRRFKEIYEHLFQNTAQKDLELVQGKDNLISKLLDGERYEASDNSAVIAKVIADKFDETTSVTTTIDHDTLIEIFTRDSFSQLSTIFDLYEDRYGRPIVEAIARQLSNEIEIQCFQDMIEFTRSPGGYYSRLLRRALIKTPVDYSTLIRILIGHEEKDLSEIKLEYSKLYDQAIDETINNRLDNTEIKRLLVMIITKRQEIIAKVRQPVRFDYVKNNRSKTMTRRRFSHGAFDTFINVFKVMRSH